MSPEQAGGMQVDPKSDVYSLGAILYELACGQQLFDAKSFGEFVSKHLNEQPIPPSLTPGGHGMQPELERIILRCLAKKPTERYDVAGLRTDLVAILSLYESGLVPPAVRPAVIRNPAAVGPASAPPWAASTPAVDHGLDAAPPGPPSTGPVPSPIAPTPSPLLRSGQPPLTPYAHAPLYPFLPPGLPAQPSPVPAAPGSGTHQISDDAPTLVPPPSQPDFSEQETRMAVGDLASGPPSFARNRRAWGFLAVVAVVAVGAVGLVLYHLAHEDPAPSARPVDTAAPGPQGPQVVALAPEPAAGPSLLPGPAVVPPPSPPGPVPKVQVALKSEPVPGDVYAQGSPTRVCRTPCTVTIDPTDGDSPERRVYVVKHAGYHDATVEVPLDAGETLARTAKLEKGPATTAPAKVAVKPRPKKKRPASKATRAKHEEEEADDEADDEPPPPPKKRPAKKIDPTDTMDPFGSKP